MKCEICGNEIKMINNSVIGLGYDFEKHEETKGEFITKEINYNLTCEFCGKHLCNYCATFTGFTIVHCKNSECVNKANEELKNYKTVEENVKNLRKEILI